MKNAVDNGVCGDGTVLQDDGNASRKLVMSQQGCGRAGKLKSGKSYSSFCLGELFDNRIDWLNFIRLFWVFQNFLPTFRRGALVGRSN